MAAAQILCQRLLICREYLVMELGDDRMKKLPAYRRDLMQKQKVLNDYIARMSSNEQVSAKYDGVPTPTVQFWCHTAESMIMLLSNNTIQVSELSHAILSSSDYHRRLFVFC